MNTPHLTPLTTLTVFHVPRGARLWAFFQMGLARARLARVPGLRFRKLLGAGRGRGFTLEPDWGRYALLAVWNDEACARSFLADSAFARPYRVRGAREASVLLRTLSAHGAWDGGNPFLPAISAEPLTGPLAVLTRATLRATRLAAFWRRVPSVSDALDRAPGLLASVGVGEAPFLRQATFSLWESGTAMRRFAYETAEHRDVIDRVRRERWYREQLFARFAVLARSGEWG